MTAALAQVPITPFPVAAEEASSGTGLRPVPSVVGIPGDDAIDRLAAEGFHGVRVTVANGDYPPGFVVAQSPCAGCLATGGSNVTLQVANGRAPVSVPNVLGLDEEAARQALDDAGFAVRSVVQAEPPGTDAGTRQGKVWKQAPVAGSAVQAGTTVTIWVDPVQQATTTTSEQGTTPSG
jgi:serine/threonine-protein kinase